MFLLLSNEKLVELITRQLNSFFGIDDKETKEIADCISGALKKVEYCFSFVKNKYYWKENTISFSPFQTDQYAIFLYYLSNILSVERNNKLLADKVYYLNKALHSADLYHEVSLPAIFTMGHPLGSVIGRAKFSNFFYFSQNCTVGNNHGIYPTFDEHVMLLAGATIIGKSHIGENCLISANTYIKDQDVPGNSLVFGASPNLNIKHKDDEYFWENSKFFPTAPSRPLNLS
jgi:serine O-acetyltransferase